VEIAGMTYNSKESFNLERSCATPEHMRTSYTQEGTPMDIQCIYYTSHELPMCTYPDVIRHRQHHMEYVCQMVEQKMQIQWASKKSDNTGVHKNFIHYIYTRGYPMTGT
jgi:hypothetical protein